MAPSGKSVPKAAGEHTCCTQKSDRPPVPPTEPLNFEEDIARGLLAANNWDIDTSERQWRAFVRRKRQEAAERRARLAQQQQGGGTALQSGAVNVAASGNDSASNSRRVTRRVTQQNAADEHFDESRLHPLSEGEQVRRDAALAFRMNIQQLEKELLSVTEAVLLMQLAGWDAGHARAEFKNLVDARRRLRTSFDSLRRRPDVRSDQIYESKCRQIMVEVTQRPDWYSLELALKKNDWNLVKTIFQWYTKGIDIFQDVPKEKRQVNGWGMRRDRYGNPLPKPEKDSWKAPGNDDLSQWGNELPRFTHPNEPSPERVVPHIYGQEWRDDQARRVRESGRLKDGRHDKELGFLITGPRALRKLGLIYEGDFYMEWFHGGRYWMRVFKHPDYTWAAPIDQPNEDDNDGNDGESTPEPRATSNGVAFDPNNSKHVVHLNQWRSKTYRDVTFETLREWVQPWRTDEEKFLYDLQDELYQAHKTQFPRSTRFEILNGMEVKKAVKDDWERRFNLRFSGISPQGETEPRRWRNAGAIVQQRERPLPLAIHFRRPRSDSDSMQKKLKGQGMKKKWEKWEDERDAMEAQDEKDVAQYNLDNPTNNPDADKIPRKERRGSRKRKQPQRFSESGDEDDGDQGDGNGDDGDGDDGDGDAGNSGRDNGSGRQTRQRRG